MEKSTAAYIFRGESAEQALLAVRGSGNFTAELISWVMNRAQGQTDDGLSEPSSRAQAEGLVEDLETLFARYTELEETGDVALTGTSEDNVRAERIKQVTVEFRERAVEAADWAASQLALF